MLPCQPCRWEGLAELNRELAGTAWEPALASSARDQQGVLSQGIPLGWHSLRAAEHTARGSSAPPAQPSTGVQGSWPRAGAGGSLAPLGFPQQPSHGLWCPQRQEEPPQLGRARSDLSLPKEPEPSPEQVRPSSHPCTAIPSPKGLWWILVRAIAIPNTLFAEPNPLLGRAPGEPGWGCSALAERAHGAGQSQGLAKADPEQGLGRVPE